MYTAQVLEHSVLNLAAGLFLTKAPVITRQVFDCTFSDLDRKTLGSQLKAARGEMSIPAEIDVVLADALAKRNYLTHHFFRGHAKIFPQERGRKQMLGELRSLIAVFHFEALRNRRGLDRPRD